MSEKKGFQKTLEIVKKLQGLIDEHESKSTRGPRVPEREPVIEEIDFMTEEKEPVIDRIKIMAKDGEALTLAVRGKRKMHWMGLKI